MDRSFIDRSNRKHLFLLFIGILNSLFLNAQYLEDKSDEDFITKTVEDGLSQNTVNCIHKDHIGYVWLGTNSGLNRYNGYKFDLLDEVKNSDIRFSTIQVLDLYEDNSGIIWIATHYGLFSFNIESETLLEENSTSKDNRSIHIYCIEEESDSLLWLGTSDGLMLFKKGRGIIKEFRHKPYQSNTISNSIVYSLAKQENMLWVGTLEGLNLLDLNDNSFSQVHLQNPNGFYGKESKILSLCLSENGSLWVGTEKKGLLNYSYNNHSFQWYTTANSNLPHNQIRDISISKNQMLWLGTNGGGVAKLDTRSNNISVINNSQFNQQSLSNNSVYCVMEDSDGVVWIGTYAGGVNFNITKGRQFKYLRQQHFDLGKFSGNRIRSLYVDDRENLWIGTWGGVTLYDHTKKDFYKLDIGESELGYGKSPTVTSVYQDSRGWYWIGTYAAGAKLLKSVKHKAIHYTHNPLSYHSISGNNVYCIEEDSEKNIWIGTSEGLSKFSVATDKFETFVEVDVRDMSILKNGDIALGIMGGIAIYNPKSNYFKSYEKPEFENVPINQIFCANEDEIWFISQGNGLGWINLKTNEYKVFHKSDGLPSEFVSSIVPHNDSVFLLSTYKGISQFNIATEEFKNFGLSDGLPGYEYYPRSAVRLPDGQIAFGGARGLVFFKPDEISTQIEQNPVVLTGLQIHNKKIEVGGYDNILDQRLSKMKVLKLKDSQKDFTFDFVAFNYSSPGENLYSYKLENYTDLWVDIGHVNTIPFTNLNSGEYVFKVKNVTNGHKNSELTEASIRIVILPPFYFSWWFITLFILVITAIIYSYARFQIANQIQKNEIASQRLEYDKQKQFHQLRMKFFANISHELRTPLTLIRGPLETLLEKNQEPKNERLLNMISRSTQRLLKLVEQILDFRKMESDALKLKVSKVNIIQTTLNIFNAFKLLSEQKDIKYTFKCEESNLEGWIDTDKIEKIVYNLISNAFKFTPEKGEIIVLLKLIRDTNTVRFIIKDNGIGVNEEKLNQIFERYYTSDNNIKTGGTGIGLAVVKRLIELHHGSISVNSRQEMGSEFVIELPISEEVYSEDEKVGEEVVEDIPLISLDIDNYVEEISADAVSAKKSVFTILVVEDEVDLRNYIFEILTSDYNVILAENGLQGFEAARKNIPDLILSDVVMPVMDGIEMCKKIKEDKKTSSIPFIFLSAWNSEEFKIKGLSSGATDYIPKPFSVNEVLIKVDNIIKNKRKLEALSKKKFNVDPQNIEITSTDEEFIFRTQRILEENIDDPEFSSKKFMQAMNMSHSLLYRKLKSLTGFSSNEFIRDYRLKRAAQIICQDTGLSILEVGIRTGFNDPKYFSQRFKKKYGINPSEFAKLSIEEQNTIMGD